jgi:glycosyltransferase involved in cell wall biosynthesis
LLTALLGQKQDYFELLEIIVVSDGSNDKTVEEARSLASDKIVIIDEIDRKGQSQRQNEITEMFKGDFLILLNADILPKNEYLLNCMIKPFLENGNIGIVSNMGTPLPAQTFFEKIINFSMATKREIAKAYNNGDNIYMCHGHSRAFSRKLAKKIKWPNSAGEDAYSYLFCKKEGYDFYHQFLAEINYRSPQNLTDHLKQSVRFVDSRKEMEKYFDKDFVKRSYYIPFYLTVRVFAKYFFKNPILLSLYLGVYFISLTASKFTDKSGGVWEVSKTSKFLIKQ